MVGPPRRERYEEEPEARDIHLAVLAYVPVMCLVALSLRRRLAFLVFHVRQGLVVFLLEIAAAMLYFIPGVGWQLALVLATACLVTAMRGMAKACDGEEWQAPLVSAVLALFHR